MNVILAIICTLLGNGNKVTPRRIVLAPCKALGLLLTCLVLRNADGTAAGNPTSRFPPLKGEYYDLDTPATLDLAERMRLSLNAITRCIDGPPKNPFPATEYLSQHFILLSAERPKTLRSNSLFGKAMLAARLARLSTGETKGIEVDDDWRTGFLDYLRIDPVMSGPEGGRWLEWIAFNIRAEEGSNRKEWEEIAKNAVERLESSSVRVADCAWIAVNDSPPVNGFRDVSSAKEDQEARSSKSSRELAPSGWDATYMAWTLQGLTALYRETKYEPARTLAEQYARYLKDHGNVIAPDGQMLAGHTHENSWPVVHWHHSFLTAVACAEYGALVGDREYLEFADRAYLHGLSLGNRSIGFVPEYCYGKYPRRQSIDNTEACCTSDIVLTALWLTDAGQKDYWDDIDRFTRNQLSELQMQDTRWFYALPENRGRWIYPNNEVESYIGPLVGNFAGWATLNEWHKPEFGCGIMNCCLGNCTRAMFYIWEKMIEYDGGTLTLHLLLNRASAWADVNAYLPYEGRVELHLKQNIDNVLVRMPEWIPTDSADVSADRNGVDTPLNWRGRYLVIKGGESGTTVSISFPVPSRTERTEIGRQIYQLTFKGNNLATVKPSGKRMPLYSHSDYLTDVAPSRQVKRFVYDQSPSVEANTCRSSKQEAAAENN